MNIFRKTVLLTSLLLICLLLTSCDKSLTLKDIVDEKTATKNNSSSSNSKTTSERLNADHSFLKNDDNNSVKYLYVTIPKEQGKSNYTFSDVNKDTIKDDDYEPELNILLQEGNSQGPSNGFFGYGLADANAAIKQRGSSTRNATQKSYKISINKKIGMWDGNTVLNLNKHPSEYTRVRNKLSFDYFKNLSDFTTLRTQFVNLYIKDLNKSTPDKEFVNYGLYTHIEQANEEFLKKRGLDIAGNLYKANFFEFLIYEKQLKNTDSPEYNKQAFEKILEPKVGKDHSKLLAMLADVNNVNLDIDEVINKHFNRENYLTWLAVNLVMGNIDTNSQNFFLYSPSNSLVWYFLPWDYDGSWGYYTQFGKTPSHLDPWKKGVSNYGGVVLTKRFLSKENNVNQLKAKVEELSKIITPETTTKMLNGYYEAVNPFLSQEPDLSELAKGKSSVRAEMDRIIVAPEKNIKDFYDSLKTPMPVFTGDPSVTTDNKHVFHWNPSYCPNGDKISYNLKISDDPDFKNVLINAENIPDTKYIFNKLEKGTYFFKLTIDSSNGNSQVTFDKYTDDKGKTYYGVRKVMIK